MSLKKLARVAWIPMILISSMALAQFEPMDEAQVHPDLSRHAQATAYGNSVGVNIDIPFTCPVICGITIIVQGNPCEQPWGFYTGIHNPWGSPSSIVESPVGSGTWVITFGGEDGPCFDRNAVDETGKPYFSSGGNFRGVHLGFKRSGTNSLYNSGTGLYNIGYAVHCEGGTYYGYGLPGHHRVGNNINVRADRAMAVADLQFAAADNVHINDLRADLLPELTWHGVEMQNNVLNAEGTDIAIPAAVLQDPTKRIIMSYSIVDPDTGEDRGNVTLDFPVIYE